MACAYKYVEPAGETALDNRTIETAEEFAVASPQQLEAEALVRELWPHPLITDARRRSKNLMLGAYGIDVPTEAMRRFDAVLDEYAVSYLVHTVSRDRENHG